MIRRLSVLLVFVLTGLLWPATAPAQQDLIQNELSSQKRRLQSLETDIKRNKAKATRVEAERVAALRKLKLLDKRITLQWKKLNQAKAAWTKTELDLVELRKDLNDKAKALGTLRSQVEQRLRALRETGTTGILNILFEAHTLPELLSRQTMLKIILEHDKKLRDRYQRELRQYAAREKELQKKQIQQKELVKRIEAEALTLEERKQEKTAFIEELRSQGDRYRGIIRELERARTSLKEIIARLSQEDSGRKQGLDNQTTLFDFAAQKGKLTPPVVGQVSVPIQKDGHKAPGVIFSCPVGTEIRAIFDGTVIFNGPVEGYGNVIILDHGHGYLSLTSQGMTFFKDVGAHVTEGEIIGLTGGGAWTRKGIYFEIRHGENYLNPLKWLDLRGLEVRD